MCVQTIVFLLINCPFTISLLLIYCAFERMRGRMFLSPFVQKHLPWNQPGLPVHRPFACLGGGENVSSRTGFPASAPGFLAARARRTPSGLPGERSRKAQTFRTVLEARQLKVTRSQQIPDLGTRDPGAQCRPHLPGQRSWSPHAHHEPGDASGAGRAAAADTGKTQLSWH